MMNLLSSKTTLIVSLLLLLGIKINAQPGTIDKKFGKQGKVFYEEMQTQCNAVAVQKDGKIIAAGYRGDTDRSKTGITIIRVNIDGTIDNTFADHGKIFINKADDAYTVTPRYLKIQEDGKILVATHTSTSTTGINIGIIRLTKDGILDSTFHENGCLSFSLGYRDLLGDIAILPDGKIIIAGLKGYPPYDDDYQTGFITRLLPNGFTDESFGENGWVYDNVMHDFEGFSMVIQNDGKIVLGGSVYEFYTNKQTVLLRYNANGTKDKSFGNEGKAVSNYPSAQGIYGLIESLNDIVLLPNNDLLIFSSSSSYIAAYGTLFINKFSKDGVFDSTFGNGKGYLLPMPEIKSARVYTAQLVQADKIIGIGYKELSKGNSIASICVSFRWSPGLFFWY